MPDLTIETYQCCSDAHPNKTWSLNGYQQYYHLGELLCTCKGFHFRRTCKHVKEVEKTQCTWNGFLDELQTEEEEQNRTCPRCGKTTEFIRVGV